MTPVKKTAKKAEAAVETVKAVEAAAEVKEEVKEIKKEEKKASTAKKTVKKAAEAAEAVAATAVAETKKATKKAAETVKKATAPEASVYVEFFGKQIAAKSVLEQALNAYKESHKKTTVKTIEIYVKPEENAAYYVVNGEGSEDFRIDL